MSLNCISADDNTALKLYSWALVAKMPEGGNSARAKFRPNINIAVVYNYK